MALTPGVQLTGVRPPVVSRISDWSSPSHWTCALWTDTSFHSRLQNNNNNNNNMLVKSVAFLGTLHWPQGTVDFWVGGVSFVEVLILYELWAGERLDLEKAVPRYRRTGRPISVSVVPFGPGTDIWRSCRYTGALFRPLLALPGGIRRFFPCEVGANHFRLRHFGWER